MHPGRLAPHILLSISIAALAVLAGLLLFPDPALAADPVFDDGHADTVELAENTGPNMNVGSPYTATDADMDTLTYLLTGDDASSFTIDSMSGQIKTKSGVTYDFEAAKNTYSVAVDVHDGKDAMDNTGDTTVDATFAVAINLTNVNEPPEISTTDDTYDFAENTSTGDAVATFEATDPDADAVLAWTLTGDDADDFRSPRTPTIPTRTGFSLSRSRPTSRCRPTSLAPERWKVTTSTR